MGGVPADTRARVTQTAKLRFFFFFIEAGLYFLGSSVFSPETGGMLFLLFLLFLLFPLFGFCFGCRLLWHPNF